MINIFILYWSQTIYWYITAIYFSFNNSYFNLYLYFFPSLFNETSAAATFVALKLRVSPSVHFQTLALALNLGRLGAISDTTCDVIDKRWRQTKSKTE